MIANLIALNAILLEHVNASSVGSYVFFWNCATRKVAYAEWQQLEDEKGGCIQIHDVYTGQSI